MSALAEADRDRLTRLLGMLGSDFDGEVLNAARLADRLVREQGITWFDILATSSLTPVPRQESRQPPWQDVLRDWPAGWQAASRLCATHGHGIIRPKDLDFAAKIAGYTHRPSEAQLVWLRDITERVLAGGAS